MDRFLPEEMRYPEEIKAYYLQDMPKLPRGDAVCHVSDLYDAVPAEGKRERQRYPGHVLVWGRRRCAVSRSRPACFNRCSPTCELYEAKGYGHGYLSVYRPEEWLQIAVPFSGREIKWFGLSGPEPFFVIRASTQLRRASVTSMPRPSAHHGCGLPRQVLGLLGFARAFTRASISGSPSPVTV